MPRFRNYDQDDEWGKHYATPEQQPAPEPPRATPPPAPTRVREGNMQFDEFDPKNVYWEEYQQPEVLDLYPEPVLDDYVAALVQSWTQPDTTADLEPLDEDDRQDMRVADLLLGIEAPDHATALAMEQEVRDQVALTETTSSGWDLFGWNAPDPPAETSDDKQEDDESDNGGGDGLFWH